MTKLKAIKPKEAKPSKAKILVFGKAGVGKTWASLDFPNVYYIDTEGGANLPHYTDKLVKSGGVYLGVEQGSNSFANILEQIKALATEDHDFKTLVIDSVSKVFNDEIANESDRLARHNEKNEFGRDKKPAVAFMKQLVSWLTRLDMNVILISHEKAEWFKQEQVGVTFDCWDKLDYELDLCLNISKQGKSHKARVTKSRLEGFGEAEIITWSYEDFAKKYGKEILEGEVVKIELATEDQIAKINSLLKSFDTEEGEALNKKWFKKAKCGSFEEMESATIQACIDFLKNKINQQLNEE